MDIKVIADDVVKVKAGAIVLGVFEGAESPAGEMAAVDQALGGAITDLIKQGEIRGKPGEVTLVHTLGRMTATRVVLAGLGKPPDLSVSKIRGAVAETCRWLRQKRVDDIAIVPLGAGVNGISLENAGQAIVEGAILGLYQFRTHLTRKDEDYVLVRQLSIVGSSEAKPWLESGSARGRVLAEAANLARDMVNEPANFMTPTHMAEVARRLAGTCGLEVSILEREQMTDLGMGALLGVAQGSHQPPKFIVLSYRGRDCAETDVALVGKAITFDSGGISLKPSEGLSQMKGDKAGGVAVMAAISAIAQLKPKINVTALVPATENMPGGNAFKPGDIVTTMAGKTVEIISTDAEGRLVLADALCYARKLGASTIIDVATLTGACRIALGEVCSGTFGNDQSLVDRVIAAGTETGERMWQLPMYDEYREQIKSDVADIKNVGGPLAGAITAAKFLAEFADSVPWVHLDIAGTSQTDKEKAHLVKGATGVPVRTLVNLVLSLAK